MLQVEQLSKLHQIAESREQSAQTRCLEARQRLNQEEAKLSALESYRQATPDTPEPENQQGWALVNRQAFIRRLMEAVRQQSATVAQTRHDLNQAMDSWLLQRREVRKIEELIARCKAAEIRHEQHRAQKELDEIGLQRARGLRAAQHS